MNQKTQIFSEGKSSTLMNSLHDYDNLPLLLKCSPVQMSYRGSRVHLKSSLLF